MHDINIDPGPLLDRLIEWFHHIKTSRRNRQIYLETCIRETDLLGIDWLDRSYHLPMESAYVPMRLMRSDGRVENLAAVMAQNDCIVIQGEAGAGKSTITRYITMTMAKAALKPGQYGDLPRQQLDCAPLFPIRIELKHCNGDLSFDQVLRNSNPRVSGEFIDTMINNGHLFVLFDGLDEIIDDKRRYTIMNDIGKLTRTLREKNNRLILTTRPYGYRHQIMAEYGYESFRLRELENEQQRVLIRRYFESWADIGFIVDNLDWQTKANDLLLQLQTNPGLARLKGNPQLLSQVAFLHYKGGALPTKRHLLYWEILRHLLTKRDQVPSIKDEELNQRLLLLGDLAIALHQQRELGVLSRSDLVHLLQETLERRKREGVLADEPLTMIDRMEKEWGVLVNRGGRTSAQERYAISNLSFQEYLASYAVHQDNARYWPILRSHLQEAWWEEVLLLYVAMSDPESQSSRLDQVLEELIATDALPPPSAWIKAGRCLATEDGHNIKSKYHERVLKHLIDQSYGAQDINVQSTESLCQIQPDGRQFVIDRIIGRKGASDKLTTMESLRRMADANARQQLREAIMAALEERPTISDRIVLAQALGQIGDARLGIFIGLPTIRAPRNTATTKIGKYPVTNMEYARFVESSGHPPPLHWAGKTHPLLEANHPVTNVTLADAQGYCEWLSQEDDWSYRLPTEEEWLAASLSSDQDRFPWGNRFDQFCLNYRKNIIGTTPVGVYPEGESQSGVADLLGNVWEWTLTREGDRYVLKGGSWDTMDEIQEKGKELKLFMHESARKSNIGFRILQIESISLNKKFQSDIRT